MKRDKKSRGFLAVTALVILLGCMIHRGAAVTVMAESGRAVRTEEKRQDAFSIEADPLPSSRDTYNIRLTIENLGEDWEGTVRLIVEDTYQIPCAYDTVLSLPQGSRKQFTVRIPMDSLASTYGTVSVTLLDRDGEEEAGKEFRRLLEGQSDTLFMGILSDEPSKLAYMEMQGEEVYFYDDYYPVWLVDMQQVDLVDTLDALTYLVIDRFNTGMLTQEELEAIERWNKAGGVLIIGTGAYAEDTLRGFEGGYLGIRCGDIYKPEDMTDVSAYDLPDYAPNMYYVDWTQMTVAQLGGVRIMYADDYIGGWVASKGDGSVGVLPYSLIELGEMDGRFWDYSWAYYEAYDYTEELLYEVGDYADSRFFSSVSDHDDLSPYIQRLLALLGNSNSILNFGVLKGIVILYVIFVGPVLYLILRFLKRRELYWVLVPVSALLGISLIFLVGRDFETANTRVYSVTVKNLSGGRDGGTYLYCYDSGIDEWELRLAEGIEYAGPLGSTTSPDDGSGYYRIIKEGDIYSLGMKPESNFEDSYFYLRSDGSMDTVEGSLLMQDVTAGTRGVEGTLVNDTDQDMVCYAVLWKNINVIHLYIYEDLPAGATCDLADTESVYEISEISYLQHLNDLENYANYVLEDVYSGGEYEKAGALSALGVGICDIRQKLEQGAVVVIGVVENWDKAVDDACSEISYGCLYSVQ